MLYYNRIHILERIDPTKRNSKECIEPFPKIRISFFVLSTCLDELISAPNIVTFSPNLLLSDNKKRPTASNPITYPECLYL